MIIFIYWVYYMVIYQEYIYIYYIIPYNEHIMKPFQFYAEYVERSTCMILHPWKPAVSREPAVSRARSRHILFTSGSHHKENLAAWKNSWREALPWRSLGSEKKEHVVLGSKHGIHACNVHPSMGNYRYKSLLIDDHPQIRSIWEYNTY